MIEPFIQGINSDDPAQRKYSVNGIGSLLISFLKTNKIRLAKRLLNFFEENIKKEEDIEVFFTYLEYLEKGYTLAKEKNLTDFIEFFEAEFKKLLDLSEKRRFVLKTLGKTGTDFALRMLLTTLWEEESIDEVKDALIPLGDKAAQELLKLFPEIDNLVVRKRILELLVSLPTWDTNHLKELLFDKRWSVQRDVIYLIGEKKVAEMIPFIEELAIKGQDIVRKEAVKALGKIKAPDAEEILIKALNDKNEEIKKEAVKSLCSNITDTVLPRIREYFKESVEKFKEENTPVLIEILKGLRKRKDKEIIPFLFKIIEEKKLFGRPGYPPLLRREAVKTLVEFDEDTDIINKLRNFTNDPDSEIKAFLKVFFAKHGRK
jgi:HEAT repeat protein